MRDASVKQHLRLDEDDLARTFQIAEQPLAVAHRQALRFLQHRARLFERFVVAFLLIRDAQLVIQLRALAAELLRGFHRLFLEARLAAVQVVEAARDLARHLDVRHLILADRHERRAIQQNVRRHQHRIAEEAVSGQILLAQLLDLLLVGRHAFEPAERRAHAEQQRQLRVLGHAALDEERRLRRIDARRQPVDEHLPDVFLDDLGRLVVRRERVPVDHREEARIFGLQPHPVFQHAVIVAEVQRPGGPHAGEDTVREHDVMGIVKRGDSE